MLTDPASGGDSRYSQLPELLRLFPEQAEVASELGNALSRSGRVEPDIDIGAQVEVLRLIQPASGRLELFPSYVWHGTVPFESDDPRMTVAFDRVPGH